MRRRSNPSLGSAVACLARAVPGCILARTALALLLLVATGPAWAGGNGPQGGHPCPPQGNPTCGDPITIATGTLFHEVIDYETAGPNKLTLTRYFNTPTPFNVLPAFWNWRSNYDSFLFFGWYR
jgi:hypothetical protein